MTISFRSFLPFGLALTLLVGCGSTVPQAGAAGDSGLTGQPAELASNPAASAPSTSGANAPAGSALNPVGQAPSAHIRGGGSGARTPIKIGVVTTDTANFSPQFGYTTSPDIRSWEQAFRSVINGLNSQGGLAGRRIQPIYVVFDATSSNYDVDHQRACAEFTQDNRVEAVVSNDGEYAPSWYPCLTQAGVPEFAVGWVSGDVADYERYPGLFNVAFPSIDRSIRARITQGLAAGYLAANKKLGVLVEDCGYNERAYQRTLVPLTRQYSISVVRVVTECYTGASQAGNTLAGFQSAVLSFQSQNVDTVMFISNNREIPTQTFARQAESQGYQPIYVLDWTPGNETKGYVQVGEYPKSQLLKMHGVSWAPLGDVKVPPTAAPAQKAARAACEGFAKADGFQPRNISERVRIFLACDALFLLRSALQASGGRGGLGPLRAGLESLGTSFVSLSNLTGLTRFGPRRHDGVEVTAITSYRTSCECFVYETSPRTMQ